MTQHLGRSGSAVIKSNNELQYVERVAEVEFCPECDPPMDKPGLRAVLRVYRFSIPVISQ
jgi:hypothetical protein